MNLLEGKHGRERKSMKTLLMVNDVDMDLRTNGCTKMEKKSLGQNRLGT